MAQSQQLLHNGKLSLRTGDEACGFSIEHDVRDLSVIVRKIALEPTVERTDDAY